MHFTLAVACLFCFLISLGKAAESEKIPDTQQFCLLNAYYFSVHNWGNRCDVDHMISICANVHKRLQERRCVSVLWSNTPCEQTGRNIFFILQLSRYCPAFFVFLLERFFLLLLKYWYAKKEDRFNEGGFEMRKEGGKECNIVGPLALFPCFTTNT